MTRSATPQRISVPTYDGNPSATHFDVIDTSTTKWNGWRYWMAFTPWPTDPRENPSIAVSADGFWWQIPAGGANPVVPLSNATDDGYTFNSDNDIVLGADGTMRLYYREYGSPGERLMLRKSTDGITWTARQQVLMSAGTTDTVLSPAFVQEADHSYAMWACSYTAGKVQRYTSADGESWSAATDCTIPVSGAGNKAWHMDVVRVGSTHYALVMTKTAQRLVIWTSTDGGLTWTGSMDTPSVGLSGESWDVEGNYRSGLVPVSGTTFDVYVAGQSNSGGLHIPGLARVTI